jgi:hypothetical protein
VVPWTSAGGTLASEPAVAWTASGPDCSRAGVFYRRGDDLVFQNWRLDPGDPSTRWVGWRELPAPDIPMGAGELAVLAPDTRSPIEVFQRAADGSLWHSFQTGRAGVPPAGQFGPWRSLGGVLVGNPSAAEILGPAGEPLRATFHRGTDGGCYYRWSLTPDPGGAWSDWTALGGVLVGDPVVARNGDGRLEVFHRGTDNRIYHRWQSSGRDPSAWARSWESLGGVAAGQPAAIGNTRGGTSVFCRTARGELAFRFFDPRAAAWADWRTITAGVTGDPSVTMEQGLTPVVAWRGSSGDLFYSSQAVASGPPTPRPDAAWNVGGSLVQFAPGDPLVLRVTGRGAVAACYRGLASDLQVSDVLV